MLICFDLDGTLFDCTSIIRESYRRANLRFLDKYNIKLELPAQEAIIACLGMPNDDIYPLLYPGLDASLYADLISFSEGALIEDILSGGGLVYEGAAEVLSFLRDRGDTLVIASNGLRSYIEAVLKANSLESYFSAIACLGEGTISCKDDIVAHHLNTFKPSRAVMIGDRDSDRKAARTNGIPFICCSFGHSDENEIEDFESVVHSLKEIKFLEILK